MAIWNYYLQLIPKSSIPSEGCKFFEWDDLQTEAHWIDRHTVQECDSILQDVLPAIDAWSENLQSWGFHDGNRIDVWTEDTRIDQIEVRLDLRDLDPRWIRVVCLFALILDCWFWSPEAGVAFSPTFDALSLRLQESDAHMFLLECMANRGD